MAVDLNLRAKNCQTCVETIINTFEQKRKQQVIKYKLGL